MHLERLLMRSLPWRLEPLRWIRRWRRPLRVARLSPPRTRTLEEITLKNDKHALSLFGIALASTSNPLKFTIGGFKGDARLTGRTIAIDTCNDWDALVDDDFSDKDPKKVDTPAAYIYEQAAKLVV